MSSMKNIDRLYEEVDGKNKIEKGTLYLVSTPIGNLSDMTYRAVHVLSGVDFIAAEDTRNTPKLLMHYGIKKPLVSYFEHNKAQRGREIADRLLSGESCALVTDAGTPAISDPGEDLVKLCRSLNIPTVPVPGACAAITALTISALFTAKFSFEGFLTTAKGDRRARLEAIKHDDRTIIFYEAPHKLQDTLKDLLSHLGNRNIALCRELTKINEEVINTTLEEAVGYYESVRPRGEFVIVVEGYKQSDEDSFWAKMTELEHVDFYVNQGLSKMDAIKAAAKDRKIPKGELYKKLL